MRKSTVFLVAIVFAFAGMFMLASCGGDSGSSTESGIVSSKSYSGHESDRDSNNFVTAYPAALGTRLDDCQLCHRAGANNGKDPSDTAYKAVSNPCNQCHLLEWPDDSYTVNVPKTAQDTLNEFGIDYKIAGRSVKAFQTIAGIDSDGDGSTNAEEIAANRWPGSDTSFPDQPMAPTIELSWDEITGIASYTQFMMMNATKQQYDTYTAYKGVKMTDLMAYLTSQYGVDFTGAVSFTMIAPDGYTVDYIIADKITYAYDKGIFYDLTDEQTGWLDPDQHFMNYPAYTYGLAQGDAMPMDVFALLAYQREDSQGVFVDLDTSYLDGATGKISGEGPYRVLRPQLTPSRPDRGSRSSFYADGWDYDEAIDHNAGDATKGTCVIRINPMPEGYEEYYWANGWQLIKDKKLVIFGHGVPVPSP